MRDYLTLGPTPCGEDCEQLGPNYNPTRAHAQCRAYARQLRRIFPGATDAGCTFHTRSFPHDFGNYLEVCAVFDDANPAAVDAAYEAEANLPESWDDFATAELNAGSGAAGR